MPRLRRVSGREAIRAPEKLGFEQVRQRGSHIVVLAERLIRITIRRSRLNNPVMAT